FLLDLLWNVSQQLFHVLFHASQNGSEHLRICDVLTQRHDDASLDELPRHEESIGARALRATEAAIVAATLPADLSHGCPAASATEHAGKEMRRVRLDVAPLLLFEAASLASDGPGSVDLHPSGPHMLPDILGHDSERLVLNNVPLVARLGDPTL